MIYDRCGKVIKDEPARMGVEDFNEIGNSTTEPIKIVSLNGYTPQELKMLWYCKNAGELQNEKKMALIIQWKKKAAFKIRI